MKRHVYTYGELHEMARVSGEFSPEMKGVQAGVRDTGRGTVVKMASAPNDDYHEWGRFENKTDVMRDNPAVFPVVYRSGSSPRPWREEEKLDVALADSVYNSMRDAARRASGDRRFDFGEWLLGYRDHAGVDRAIRDIGREDDMREFSSLCMRVMEVTGIDPGDLDFHGGQFGYDKSGVLKCLDF